MRPAHCAALPAARQTGQLYRQVAASLALTRLWITFLWKWWHLSILSSVFRSRIHALLESAQCSPTIIHNFGLAVMWALVQVGAAVRAEPFAVRPAEGRHL